MLFMAGVPDWMPSLQAAAAARERVIDAVNRHHEAIVEKLEGRDTDSRWSDDLLTDCSKVIVDRAATYHKLGADGRTRATGESERHADGPLYLAGRGTCPHLGKKTSNII